MNRDRQSNCSWCSKSCGYPRLAEIPGGPGIHDTLFRDLRQSVSPGTGGRITGLIRIKSTGPQALGLAFD